MTEQSGTTETAAPPGASSEDESAQFRSLLASGERVLLVKRRHWFTFVEAGRWFVLSLGIGIGLLLLGQGVPDDGVTGFLNTLLDYGFGIFVLIGIAGAVWYYIVWRVERYLVTTRRVIEAGGVINKYTRDTSLAMITDMVVNHPWLGRIVGYGEIDLLTGSEAGTSKIRFLPSADAFKTTLLDAKHAYELEVGGGRALSEALATAASTGAVATAPSGRASISAEELDASISRLADLRDRGLISGEEFEQKKRELLERL